MWQIMPRPAEPDILFVQSWMEEWGMAFEISISAYRLGLFQESVAACDYLLSLKDLPQVARDLTVSNRQVSLQRLEEQKSIQTIASIVEPSVKDEPSMEEKCA